MLRSLKITNIIVSMLLFPILLSCSDTSKIAVEKENPVIAAEKKQNQLSLGINLYGIADWSTQYPFLDHFKTARSWIPQCVRSDPNCEKKWSTGENDLLDLDENGWVKSLPKPEDSVQFTRVSTIIGNSKEFPQGKYIVLYDGEGEIKYGWSAKKIESESKQGRDVIEVDSSKKNGVLMTITATHPPKNRKLYSQY